MKKKNVLLGVIFLLIIVAAMLTFNILNVKKEQPSIVATGGAILNQPIFIENKIKQVSSVVDEDIAVYNGSTWEKRFWQGINLGATTPGFMPGDLSPTKDDYLRWFKDIKKMNVDFIRIYTILPPYFYEALSEFNNDKEEPLWLVQGIWAPEEAFVGVDGAGNDAFSAEIKDEFENEIIDVVKAVHGDLERPARYGHASGEYTSDVSRYILGWLVGTEWYEQAVAKTNNTHPNMKPYVGEYFSSSEKANAFENFLAEMLDTCAKENMKYGWQHPISFTNWVTTDPLEHPNEPLENEDLVSVDPMHIAPTNNWKAGYYASYHVYPYYPDSLRFEPKYLSYKNKEGKIDPYAGYLKDLREHHKGIPLVVAEFGVPSSRGMAHRGPLNRHQGMHTEQEQGKINAELMENIYNEGYDGGILFAWQDEWFKITWNTMDLLLPKDRRARWLNRLTNEANFGVMAMEPGKSINEVIKLDGKNDDWEKLENKKEEKSSIYKLSVSNDEAYVYIILEKFSGNWDLNNETINLGFDVTNGGSILNKENQAIKFQYPIEFYLALNNKNAEIFVNSSYDYYTWLYGEKLKLIPTQSIYRQDGNGIFLPWNLVTSKELYLPLTKETIPFENITVGKLVKGITDANDKDFNSLADWYVKDNIVEMRIPWMLLGYTDPSTHQVWEYPYKINDLQSVTSEGINIQSFITSSSDNKLINVKYTWENWELPTYHERKKQSYYYLQEYFKNNKNRQPIN